MDSFFHDSTPKHYIVERLDWLSEDEEGGLSLGPAEHLAIEPNDLILDSDEEVMTHLLGWLWDNGKPAWQVYYLSAGFADPARFIARILDPTDCMHFKFRWSDHEVKL